jgi:tetratricopeptide (TPR) repeat protein
MLEKEIAQRIADASQAIMADSNNAESWFIRGWAYSMRGDADAAIRDLTQAIALNQTNGRYHAHRADVYFSTGDYERALAPGK